MKITEELIDYLGTLARLEIRPEEKAALGEDLTEILSYVERLSELDTEGIAEMSQPFDRANCFREDELQDAFDREALLAVAPRRKGAYYQIFRTVEGE